MLRQAFYYDDRSNLTCVLDPQDGLTYYTYDAARRMTSAKNPWGQVAYYDYTPGGRLTRRVLGNGCVTYYSYDAVGQVTAIEDRKADLSLISSFEYQRDLLGNPVSIRREDGSCVYYEYDAKSQLTRETQRDAQGDTLYAWEWAYDPAGNRLWQVVNGEPTYYEYNAANELSAETTAAGTTYYDYDRCGNTVAKREPGGATTSYHWDYENLLRQVDLPGGAHNYFAYDADGKRVEKRDSAGTARFTYQAGNMLALLQERDAGGNLTAHYTMGNGLEAMQRDTGSGIEEGSVSFYHYDALGSTFALTDEDEAVTDTYRYNAWGEVLTRTGDTDNPHMYVGNERYYWGQDLGLYLLGLRWYDQTAGRFVTVDPAATRASHGDGTARVAIRATTDEGSSPYAYALNAPYRFKDPLGLRAWADDDRPWSRAQIHEWSARTSNLMPDDFRRPDDWVPYDCADYALSLLVRVASSMQKRVCLWNPQRPPSQRELNSSAPRFGSPEAFLKAARRVLGATHLRHNNTGPVGGVSQTMSGDMFISETHTRVIRRLWTEEIGWEPVVLVEYYATDPNGPLEHKTTTYRFAAMDPPPRRWRFDLWTAPRCCKMS